MPNFMPEDKIAVAQQRLIEMPDLRIAQTELAREVTTLIHGEDAAKAAFMASAVLFGGVPNKISEEVFNHIVGEVPTKEIEKSKLEGAGISLVELLVHSGLCLSKGQAKKDVESGGIYITNIREASVARAMTSADLLFGKHILLRKGKKNYVVVTAK